MSGEERRDEQKVVSYAGGRMLHLLSLRSGRPSLLVQSHLIEGVHDLAVLDKLAAKGEEYALVLNVSLHLISPDDAMESLNGICPNGLSTL